MHASGDRHAEAKAGAELDDAAEAADDRYGKMGERDNRQSGQSKKEKKGKWSKDKKQKGQNTSRTFGSSHDKIQLCASRQLSPEFSPKECPFGDKCRFSHDLRSYLESGRRPDLTTFKGKCPIFEAKGSCHLGWKCRFHLSHSSERETNDGRKELVLTYAEREQDDSHPHDPENEVGVVNVIPKQAKIDLSRRRMGTPKADAYIKWTSEVIDNERAQSGKPSSIEMEDGGEDPSGMYCPLQQALASVNVLWHWRREALAPFVLY